jgi:hypothetical protein
MRFSDRVRKWRDETLLVAAAVVVLAILEYDSFLERRRKRGGL